MKIIDCYGSIMTAGRGLMDKTKKKLKINKKKVKDWAFALLIQLVITGAGVAVKFFFNASDHLISQIYILGVLIISLMTDGYVVGISSALLDVFIINFFFTDPFMTFNLNIDTLPSLTVAFVVAVASTVLTTKVHQSEKEKMEAEKERMRANLLRAVSHDIRTPLTAIYGSTSTVIDSFDTLTKTQIIQLLKDVRDDSEWLVRMVENLLSVTRVTEGEVSLNKTSVPVEELVGMVVSKFTKRNEALLQGDEYHKPVAFKVEMPDHYIFVEGDAMLLGQVLNNLLDNAVYHAEGMSKLGLTVVDNKEDVIFNVWDDGCGIAPERLDTIFTGTYKSQDKKADNGRSNMGIGLSVCASIIKAHGGNIVAKNRPEGGASFSFALKKEEDEEGVE